jgi:predicted transcriptional regulator
MIKDFLISFKDNFREKTRNPFLGTYLFVWFIRNWELVYSLFNFDSGCTLADKVSFVKNYYAKISFLENIGTNIFWAIGLLALTYILLNVSRLIVNIFEKLITPWIYRITDKGSIVLKLDYEKLNIEREKIQKRFEEEREKRLSLETEIEKLEARINVLNNPIKFKDEDLTEPKLEDEKLARLIESKGYTKIFENLIFTINADEWVIEEEGHRFLVTLGLIQRTEKSNKHSKFVFTKKGLSFQEYYRKSRLFTDFNK